MECKAAISASAQLEEMHPCLSTDTRFCIVGAGPSGLSAAYALVKLGYANVTIFEKNNEVAGMCETVDIDGRFYDLGGQVVARDSAPTILSLVKEMQLEMENMDDHKLAIIDCSNKAYTNLSVAHDYMSIMPLTLKLQTQASQSNKLGLHAAASLASDVSPLYVKNAGLKGVPHAVSTGYTASGYGFVCDMAYAYLHEFTRTSMLGKMQRVKTGYASLWKKMADKLPSVRTNTEVVQVTRDCETIKVTIRGNKDQRKEQEEEEREFDRIIISGSLPYSGRNPSYRSSPWMVPSLPVKSNLVMDFSDQEEELFSKVKCIEYYTSVLKVSGLDLPKGFYYCKGYVEDPIHIGHPVALQRFHEETDIYLFWSYGNSDINQDKVIALLYEDVRTMGATVEKLILVRKWVYFPHVSSEDMKSGFYDKLESLQGQNKTAYVGGLMAFELTERVAAYSMNLITKLFASTSNKMPYVKRLFELPLEVEKKPYAVEELKELEGVEFPDLPTVDAYLQYWAQHSVMGNRILYTWLNEEGKEIDSLTYFQVDRDASCIAKHLLTSESSIRPGDRVLLIYPPGLQFILAFFGCLRAGVLPVPLIPPDPMQCAGQPLVKVEKVAHITESKAILSTRSYHSAVKLGSFKNSFSRNASAPNWPNLPWYLTDAWVTTNKSEGKHMLLRMFSKRDITPPSSPKESNADARKPPSPRFLAKDCTACTLPPQDFGPIYTRNCPGHETGIPNLHDICFLQFTSGSTGDPKGVIITHGGLIHNVKVMRNAYKSTTQTVLVSWLPQYHDMGLIGGLFTAMVSGGTAVLFSPMTFIRKPILWLETMSRYKATHSAGPNFAFELVVRRYSAEVMAGRCPTFNLSNLRFLMISAEPIRHKTVKSFVEMFHPSGLKEQAMAPGYGLAENCVFVSCAWGNSQPIMIDWQGKVCCGFMERGHKDIDIRIVSPQTCTEIKDGSEGEVWVYSPSSGAGYWGKAEEGAETFQNTLQDSSRWYIRTGDLGRIVEKKLFITGRIKDLIIIQGRNVYPSDVEKTVEDSCNAVRAGCCAVFGAPQHILEMMGITSAYSSDSVGVVVVTEVRDGAFVDSKVIDKIKEAVTKEHGVEVACVTLVKPRSISKTTSGKIQRFECLKQFSEGKLQVVPCSVSLPSSPISWPSSPVFQCSSSTKHTRSNSFNLNSGSVLSLHKKCKTNKSMKDIQTFITELVSEQVGINPSCISPSDNLVSLGLNSSAVVWAAQKLTNFLGFHVAAIDISAAGSIDELCNILLTLSPKYASGTQQIHKHEAPTTQLSKRPTKAEIQSFLIHLIAERTGLAHKDVSVTQSLISYGVNSVAVVSTAQKLSNFIGTNVAAIDIYSCSCIQELVDFLEALMHKAHSLTKPESQYMQGSLSPSAENTDQENSMLVEMDVEPILRPSNIRKIFISILQFMGILFASAILLLPAVFVSSLVVALAMYAQAFTWLTVAVGLLPAVNMAYIVAVGAAISLIAKPFLQPNYARDHHLPLWTVGFVKWWTLYRLQDFATTTVASVLHGSIFMTWWYRAMGANIGKGTIINTTDVCEPGLLHIGKGVTLSEGVTLQAHHVADGFVHFRPITMGSLTWMGPYSLATDGTRLPSGSNVNPLQMATSREASSHQTQDELLQQKLTGMYCPSLAFRQFVGLYLVTLVPVVSAVLAYPTFLWLATNICYMPKESFVQPSSMLVSKAICLFFPLAATLPWHVSFLAPIIAFSNNLHHLSQALVMVAINGKALSLVTFFAGIYGTYGFILCLVTCGLKWSLVGAVKPCEGAAFTSNLGFRMWLVHALIKSTHIKFTALLFGTEALCMYLRSMGAKIGHMASIRGVNPLVDPDLLNLHDSCHLGDFAKVITTMINKKGKLTSDKVSIGANSVVGAQSVILPGTTLERDVLLGAMSVTRKDSVYHEGGVYVGVENNIMVNRQPTLLRTAPKAYDKHDTTQMETLYKKIIADLAARIATTTLTVKTRYFHRVGVAGKGRMHVIQGLPGCPEIFSSGKVFSVIVRHSNSLSSDDDARADARGAALRIIAPSNDTENIEDALIDLTMQSGKAFYARTIADFVSWLMGNRQQRIHLVQKMPHIGRAVWASLRKPNSFTELHYYTNTCSLLRSTDLTKPDNYVRFCLRPADLQFTEDEGRVEPQDILPPDTGMVGRDISDTRPPHFLADDFRRRILSEDGVNYVLQVQLRPVSQNLEENEAALDCTTPWDENIYPFKDVAHIYLDELLDKELVEKLRFNPMNKIDSLDMIHAKSATESASVDHGRYLAYAVAQQLRNGLPLKKEWAALLDEVDTGKSLLKGVPLINSSGCPALSPGTYTKEQERVHQKEKNGMRGVLSAKVCMHNIFTQAGGKQGFQFIKVILIRGVQPLLQTMVPVVFLMLAMYPAALLLSFIGSREGNKSVMYAFIPLVYVLCGFLLSCLSIACRMVLRGRATKTEEPSKLWGLTSLYDTTWQAVHTILCTSFLELTKGSMFCILYFKGLGANISLQGVYMDTLHVLNPDLLNVGASCCIGRNALLFGHLFEGGHVMFKRVDLEERSCVGTRALLLPGLRLQAGARLPPLGLGMKDEVVACY